jgi:putative transposase
MLTWILYLVFRRLLRLLGFDGGEKNASELEGLVLRHQLSIFPRQIKRPTFRLADRSLMAGLSRSLPRERWRSFLVRPETLLRWHRRLVARKRPDRIDRPGDRRSIKRFALSCCASLGRTHAGATNSSAAS